MKKISSLVALLLLISIAASCNRQPQGSTVVIILRHAEKASEADDSPLNDAGTERAQAFARVAQDAGVSAVYVTQFRRTHDTAQPLVQKSGVTLTEVPVDPKNIGDYQKKLTADITANHKGQAVAVIGHSNTVGPIVESLLGRPVNLGDVQFSDLFIVTIPPAEPATLIRAEYGAIQPTVSSTMK